MLLSFKELLNVVSCGFLRGLKSEEQIQGSSIDVRLGNTVFVERPGEHKIRLSKREAMLMDAFDITNSSYDLKPGEFILTHTEEEFFMPRNLSATFHLKSTSARSGLGHLLAVHIDPGFNNSVLTLEIHNVSRYHTVTLDHGVSIGQILFWKHDEVPEEFSYALLGHYNNDHSVSGVKP